MLVTRHTPNNRSTGGRPTTNTPRTRHGQQRTPLLAQMSSSKACGVNKSTHPTGTVPSAASSPWRSLQEASFPCTTAPASRISRQRGLGSVYPCPGETGKKPTRTWNTKTVFSVYPLSCTTLKDPCAPLSTGTQGMSGVCTVVAVSSNFVLCVPVTR